MKRIRITPRPDWQRKVESVGLTFHTTEEGQTYWDESAYYTFSPAEIDQIELATLELNTICLQAVEHILTHELWEEFQIPDAFQEFIRQSWDRDEISIVGRFDLLYDGVNPPKLAEYNADTPTALVEASIAQWFWLQELTPEVDQFNSIHERLLEVWQRVKADIGKPVTFVSVDGHLEDFMTVTYLRDLAQQAGLLNQYFPVEQIGWNAARRAFVDLKERPLDCVFKLYPWEWLMGEKFGQYLPGAATRWLEPPWKALLSNKAILPLLWKLFPEHPNLLPASWRSLPGRCVKKPTLGREGANITILEYGQKLEATEGDYGDGAFIYQQFHETPSFDGNSAVLGSWLVNGHACGMGIREESGLITTNTSRFVPHRIDDRQG
ncbi:MAG: glutathionylspermidine synthase family protein [Planctomycetes bacterium]|jgi:glutathionylspermidine synthase|nr:glutathionylspermidine synthase family protein [Planctomycetota bacterium]